VPPGHSRPFRDPLSKEVNIDTTRSLDRFPVRVFLCGPEIKAGRRAKQKNRQTDLRVFIKSKLASEMKRCIVRLGEHKEMIRAYTEATGRRASNLANHEFSLVTNKMDVVIIFPSSPGSFAELGMFCLAGQVAEKLRIIIDMEFKKSKGYVMLGPVKAAEQNNAKVVFVNYRKRLDVWHEVRELVLEVKAKKRMRRLIGQWNSNVRG